MTIVDNLGAMAKLATQLGSIELRQLTLELQQMCAGLIEENRELRERARKADDALAFQSKLTFRNNAYWMDGDGEAAGPFCPTCWDKDKTAIRMMPGARGYMFCNVSKTSVRIDGGDWNQQVRLTR